jgi:pyruvate/2-oxoglutarate dehydrogenase complex dihydrolipoamide dehydrogenase (E3) component
MYLDAINLKALVDNSKINTIAVIGGGYIGVETAETLLKCGKKIKLIHSQEHLVNTYYDSEFAELLEKRIAQIAGDNFEFIPNIHFEEFDFDSNKQLGADAFVVAIGFAANSGLGGDNLRREFGAYLVDEHQRVQVNNSSSKIDNIFAVGDAATSHSNITNKPTYLAIGSNTQRESQIVAQQVIAGVKGEKPTLVNRGSQGSNALSIMGLNLAATGLTEIMAQRNGFDVESVTFVGEQLAPYLPNLVQKGRKELPELENGKIMIKIVFEKESHRLIGAQMATHMSSCDLMHMFSLAIYKQMTIEELRELDMFFLPQLNQLYNVAVRALNRAVK